MLRRLFGILILLLLGGFALLWATEKISPLQLPAALKLATGMSAKLACSSHFISGFDRDTVEDDLATYSELMRQVEYRTHEAGGFDATLFGTARARARFRPGLGCTLEYGPNQLDQVQAQQQIAMPGEPWPRGAKAPGLKESVQQVLQVILAEDNSLGQRTRALLVVQGGRIVAEAYGPGITHETPLLGWSMGKSITAIMVGRLESMGVLDVADAGLFPEWAADRRSTITLENLLQMSSGLDFNEDYVPGSDSTRMLFMSPSASDIALQSPLAHVPGEHFSYSSGTTNLLSRLVFQRLGGTAQRQLDFFQREFAGPMGLQTMLLEPDASGVYVGSSYVYGSARDWARFGQLMVSGGEINGTRLLSEDWVKRAVAPNKSANDPRYGYQFWLNGEGNNKWWPSLPQSAYAMQGNRKQVVMMLPSHAAVIVRLGWSSGEYPIDQNFQRILAALGR